MESRRNFLKFLSLSWLYPITKTQKDVFEKKEIPLFDFYIAGYQYYDAEKVICKLKNGDALMLKREPDNKYDDQAIEVYTKEGIKLGYIPQVSNIVPKNIMDNNIILKAHIKEIDKEAEDWEKILVSVSQMV